jgi:hypothetical protein
MVKKRRARQRPLFQWSLVPALQDDAHTRGARMRGPRGWEVGRRSIAERASENLAIEWTTDVGQASVRSNDLDDQLLGLEPDWVELREGLEGGISSCPPSRDNGDAARSWESLDLMEGLISLQLGPTPSIPPRSTGKHREIFPGSSAGGRVHDILACEPKHFRRDCGKDCGRFGISSENIEETGHA